MFGRKARDAAEQENKNNEDFRVENTKQEQDGINPPRMQFLGFGLPQPVAPEPEHYIPPEEPLEQLNNNNEQLLILQEPPAPPPEEPTVEESPPPGSWKKDKIVIVLAIALAIIILTLVYFTLILGTHLDTGTNTRPQPTEYPVPTPTPTPVPTPQPTPAPTQIIPPKQIIIGDATINVRLAITEDEQMKGLQYTDRLGPNEGMLYIMNTPDTYPFWGKDMKYPIDIIFVSSDRQVADYAENVQPCQDCMMFKPERSAQYIVEVNAGFVKEHFVEINDPVVFVY